MDLLQERRESANRRIAGLQVDLRAAHEIARGQACVYVTGSYGRGEASEYSDLDWFVVSRAQTGVETGSTHSMDQLKNELVKASRSHRFPASPGTNEYGLVHSVEALVSTLGHARDDVDNTFTARLLLLLESRVVLEKDVYLDVVDQVLGAYWRDFYDNRASFVQAISRTTFYVFGAPSVSTTRRGRKANHLKRRRSVYSRTTSSSTADS